jgi:predicted component of type VI protein secretion system
MPGTHVGCPMPAQLVSLSEEPSILLDKPILLVGRHPECDIQIDSRKVSRRHCCIAQVSDYLVVRDLGSTNGIRINGTRVLEGRLNAQDELMIGGNRYQVSWDVMPAAPRSARPAAKSHDGERPFQAVAPDEDDLLEACDEPRSGERPGSRIVPEDLDLAPGSDLKVRMPRPPLNAE